MEVEIKKLFQMFEELVAKQRVEIAQAAEMTDLKIPASRCTTSQQPKQNSVSQFRVPAW